MAAPALRPPLPILPSVFSLFVAAASLATRALGTSQAGNVTLLADVPAGAEPLLSGVTTAQGAEVTVWAVPLRAGLLLPLDYVATCARLGMRPVCEGGDDCEWSDDVCVPLKIEQANCGHPLRGLRQQLAASNPDRAPSLEGLCSYESLRTFGWDSGACLAPGGGSFIPGNLADGARRAACAGPVGDTVEAGFLVQAGQCTVSSGCVTSPNQFGSSDSVFDGDGCVMVALHTGVLKVQDFATGSSADVLTVRGQPYSGSSGPDGVAVSSGDVLAWTSQGLLDGSDESRWRICLRWEDAASGDKVKELAQEVRQDHRKEAALRGDLAAAEAEAKAKEREQAALLRDLEAEAARARAAEENATARVDGRGKQRADDREVEGRLRRAVARLQGGLFTDVVTLAAVISVMLAPLVTFGALLALRGLGSPAPRLGWEGGALAAPLLAASSCQVATAPRSPPGLEAGGGFGFEPRVTIIEFPHADGSRAKDVYVEAPAGHAAAGCRTIRGSVQELAGTGVRLRLIEDHGAAAAEPGTLESGSGVGVWERTLTFEDGPWEVQDPDVDAGRAFDKNGVWQIHLVRRLPGRSFPVCPHVDMAKGSEGGAGALGYDTCSMATSIGEAIEEASCAFVEPHSESCSSSDCLAFGDPGDSGNRPGVQPRKPSSEESGDEEYVSNGLISEEELHSPEPEPPVTPPLDGSRASSCDPHSGAAATEWHVVTGSNSD